MTGYKCRYLRHRCDDKGCYLDQLPSWDDLLDCFPRKIRPTDIDGMVEINGHFLFLEEKRAGAGPDDGQRLALKALSTRPGVTTVFFRPGAKSELEMLTFGLKHPPEGWQPVSRESFKQWLSDWAIAADGTT
jgi:hypothetical protein